MKKKVFLATRNEGKIQRFKNLLQHTGLQVDIYTPKDLALEGIEVDENEGTLVENAKIKARAYFGKVDMPILAHDAGFWVKGEGLVLAPKRIALDGADEKMLTEEKMAKILLKFWKNIARKHGGKVDAAWVEAFVLLNPDGQMRIAESQREVILTDTIFGEAHIQMPIRSLYLSKVTNKPALKHTQKEEILEMQPVIQALSEVLA